jgi:hypothetical protein
MSGRDCRRQFMNATTGRRRGSRWDDARRLGLLVKAWIAALSRRTSAMFGPVYITFDFNLLERNELIDTKEISSLTMQVVSDIAVIILCPFSSCSGSSDS